MGIYLFLFLFDTAWRNAKPCVQEWPLWLTVDSNALAVHSISNQSKSGIEISQILGLTRVFPLIDNQWCVLIGSSPNHLKITQSVSLVVYYFIS